MPEIQIVSEEVAADHYNKSAWSLAIAQPVGAWIEMPVDERISLSCGENQQDMWGQEEIEEFTTHVLHHEYMHGLLAHLEGVETSIAMDDLLREGEYHVSINGMVHGYKEFDTDD